MATHKKLNFIEFNNGKHSFCIDQVKRDDEDGRIEYAFVWRGGVKSPQQFLLRPAYFTWDLLGKLIRKSLSEESISEKEKYDFLNELLGLKKTDI